LEQYLLLSRDLRFDPQKVNGSYAGAMGLPQFMPHAYRQFAVSYRGDGRPNLLADTDDVVVSVANYLYQMGWGWSAPIAVRARVEGHAYKHILTGSLRPKLTLAQLSKYRVYPKIKMNSAHKAVLLELQGKRGKEYWLAFDNFYVLSKYNNSAQYVLAVALLGRDIQNKMTND
jgi:membrane-bound lytic murein transglycosylase B